MASILMALASKGSTAQSAAENMFAKFYVPLPNNDTPGFETIQRDSQYTWIAQNRLDRDPAMQFVGPGQDSIVIEGKQYPFHFGGISTIEQLRSMGRVGKPYTLIRFFPLENPRGQVGQVVGDYVINRVRTVEQKIGVIGIAHRIDFTLELTKYGGDGATDDGPIFQMQT
jgi:phage protein U